MSRYKVIQFYPNLGTPCIVHGYDSKSEAYEDINICRNYAEVPYIAIDEKGKTMSKYYKAQDLDYAMRMKYAEEDNEEREKVISEICRLISDLPTIEVSEDDLYIPLNNQTVERINRLHKDECGEYFDEEWLFNELEQISEFREVSEDCISRAWVRAKLDYISYAEKDPISIAKRIVDDAPSVVPKPKEGEWVKVDDSVQPICSKCGMSCSGIHRNADYSVVPTWKYCPNCGAKMKGVDE